MRSLAQNTVMASQEVKLLGAWFSPYVRMVQWALKLKGVEYEYVEEDIFNKSPLLLKYNPVHKKVPVLFHGGKPISESLIILEYIDETWKQNPIFPEDPYERARVRFWAKFAQEKLMETGRNALFSEGMQQEKEVKQAKEALDILEGELFKCKKNTFFGGETIGFLDIVFGWNLWIEALDEASGVKVFDSHKYPSICEWTEKFQELPVIKENLPSMDEVVVCSKERRRQFILASSTSK